MQVHPVTLDLHLPPDQILDVFLIQWHTSLPINGGGFQQIQTPFLEEKRDVLQHFTAWLTSIHAEATPMRPAFILIPELSLPLSQVPLIEALAAALPRPTVIIAGLEHLQPQQYAQLHASTNDTPYACPQVTAPWVNAAIIVIRDEAGHVTKRLQTKLHPSPPEEPQLHLGNDLLLFCSSNQSNGRRMNFCAQICSDFTDAAFVNTLRTDIEASLAGRPLDMLCLLQYNPDQDSEQFLQAYQTYFTPPSGMAETRQGCIVAVNNANPEVGTAADYGGSRFIFDRELAMSKFSSTPPSTYWVKDDNAHRITSAVVRDYGPGIYRFEYKPKYLVSGNPGTGQILPFTHPPLYCPISELPSLASGNKGFCTIHPETFWWSCRTASSDRDIYHRVAVGWVGQPLATPPRTLCTHCWEDYSRARGTWLDYMFSHPEQPRNILRRYFEHQRDQVGFPDKAVEPNSWSPDTAAAACDLIMTHALLSDAAEAAGAGPLVVAFDDISHASMDSEGRVLYLWCQRELTDELTIIRCRDDTRLQIASMASPLLLVLVGCIRQLPNTAARRTLLGPEQA
jgi:hypothetical protein